VEDRTMSACANRHLKSLERLWEERRADRPLPSRAELDVSVLRPWLGSLALFEFQSDRGPVSVFVEPRCTNASVVNSPGSQ
jgi:hypothetical protein